MKSKLISLMLALCIVVSATPAFAFFANDVAIPETGVLTYHDFENNSVSTSAANQLQAYSGGVYNITSNPDADMYYANVAVKQEQNGNKYVVLGATSAGFAYGIRDRQDTKLSNYTEYFSSGILKLEYKVLVPETENETFDSNYMYYRTLNNSGKAAYFNQVSSTKGNASINFATKLRNGTRPTDDAVANGEAVKVVIENNRWYTVTMIVDYEKRQATQYLDGEFVAAYTTSAKDIIDCHGFSVGGFTKAGNEADISTFMWIDDFLVERLAGGIIKSEIKEFGSNYVDVKFATGIDKSETPDPEDYELKVLGEADAITAETAELIESDVLRVTFAEDFKSNTNYELILNGTLTELGNPDRYVKVGTKLLFVTEAEISERILLDQNFDDVTFPTAETSADFEDFYYEAKDADGNFTTQKDLTYKYVTGVEGGDAEANATIMQVSHLREDGRNSQKAVVFPFENGLTARSGILEVEFEASTDGASTGYFELAFGLRDTANPETSYDYNTAWSDAAQFAGLVHKTSKQKYLVPAMRDAKGHLASYYMGSVASGNMATWWNDSYNLAEIDFAGKTASDSLDKYKLVIDLDKDMFEIYYNDANVYTSNYLPGNVTDGNYDAFVLTSLRGSSQAASTLYFDNLKIKHTASVANGVKDISFEKYDGTKYSYGELLPAGTKKIIIDFKNELDDSTISENIEILGGDDSYFVYADGAKAVIELDNCLTAETEYTILVKADLLDKTEMPLGKELPFVVNTDEGEVIYNNPVVTLNGSPLNAASGITPGDNITVEASYINTTPNKKSFCVVLLAYEDLNNDGVLSLKGVAANEYYADSTSPYTDTCIITKTADASFVGAKVVKAFVFNNISDLNPLTDAFVAE